MALVRREVLLGQADRLVTDTVSHLARTQPVATRSDVAGAGWSLGGGPTGTAPGESTAPGGEAAAVATPPASFGAVLGAFTLIAVAGAGSWALWSSGNAAAIIRPPDTTAVFGVLLVFAAAVERILEPFSRWLPGRRTEAALERAIADLANRSHQATQEHLAAVAEAKARVERARGNRAIVAWGIATAVATLASTAGGFYILHAIAGQDWHGLPSWVDGIVTGLVVGSGTKPVHDLISRVQEGKEQAQASAR